MALMRAPMSLLGQRKEPVHTSCDMDQNISDWMKKELCEHKMSQHLPLKNLEANSVVQTECH